MERMLSGEKLTKSNQKQLTEIPFEFMFISPVFHDGLNFLLGSVAVIVPYFKHAWTVTSFSVIVPYCKHAWTVTTSERDRSRKRASQNDYSFIVWCRSKTRNSSTKQTFNVAKQDGNDS
jgi:hypothetical protein